ncbi:VOC family protein [Xanthomonas oryzae]|uniref:VOC family protein n=1 Tax=Xanthomonas oryzae TaxID=347 RepID=UPI001F49A378|nr:VOC family protein [Xanthomonas oryzae]
MFRGSLALNFSPAARMQATLLKSAHMRLPKWFSSAMPRITRWHTEHSMTDSVQQPDSALRYHKIDHIALAVDDLEASIALFRDQLGFVLTGRRHITGKTTGMRSAEMQHGDLIFVLCQSTEPQSQVSRLIAHHGAGVAHIALRVDDAHATAKHLRERGLAFDTNVIEGQGLRQIFSDRSELTGLSFEFIERNGEVGFQDASVSELLAQLERSVAY